MTSPWRSRMDNAIGGIAAAFICWAAATGVGYISNSEPVVANIETLVVQNPLRGKGASALSLKNWLQETFNIDASNFLAPLAAAPGVGIATLRIYNSGRSRSKQVEVSFGNGVIIYPGKPLIEPNSTLQIDGIQPKSGIDVYLAGGIDKSIVVTVDNKIVDVVDWRLLDINYFGLPRLVFDNQWPTVIFAAIGIIATLYFIGFVGVRLYRFARPRFAKLVVASSIPVTPSPAPAARPAPTEQPTPKTPPRRDLN